MPKLDAKKRRVNRVKGSASRGFFRRWKWVLIPVAAGTVTAFEESRGQHRLFVVEDANLPSLDDAALDPCARQIERTTLPVGSDHVFNPRWALRGVVETFADLHNAMVIDRLYEDASGACFDGNVPAN